MPGAQKFAPGANHRRRISGVLGRPARQQADIPGPGDVEGVPGAAAKGPARPDQPGLAAGALCRHTLRTAEKPQCFIQNVRHPPWSPARNRSDASRLSVALSATVTRMSNTANHLRRAMTEDAKFGP